MEAALSILSRACISYMDSGQTDKAMSVMEKLRHPNTETEGHDPSEKLPPLAWSDPLTTGALRDSRKEALALIRRCSDYAEVGQTAAADACFQEITKLVAANTEAGSVAEADAYGAVGFHFRVNEQPQWARRCYDRSLELANAARQTPLVREYQVAVLIQIAHCHADERDIEGITFTINRALELIPSGRPDVKGDVLADKAKLLHRLGDSVGALVAAESAVSLFRELDSLRVTELENLIRAIKLCTQ